MAKVKCDLHMVITGPDEVTTHDIQGKPETGISLGARTYEKYRRHRGS